jgi:hypothetical protein
VAQQKDGYDPNDKQEHCTSTIAKSLLVFPERTPSTSFQDRLEFFKNVGEFFRVFWSEGLFERLECSALGTNLLVGDGIGGHTIFMKNVFAYELLGK